MPLSDVVSVTISTATQTVSRKGFGTGMLAAYHTAHVDRIREYADYQAVLQDHAATTVIARAAAKFFGQNPRGEKLKIGRRALAMSQTFKVTPVTTTEGFVHKLEITTPANVKSTVSHTNGAAETVENIIDQLKIAIDALSLDLTVTDNITDMDIDANNAGELFDLEDKSDTRPGNVTIKNTTADPGIATDLAAISAVDADWYWAFIDSNSEAEGLAAAAYFNALTVMFATDSFDNEIDDVSVTDDYFSDLETQAYARVFGVRGKNTLSFAGAAACGRIAPFTPGEFNIFLKTLEGVTVMDLSGTQITNINNKTGNHYTELGGLNVFREAKTFKGEFIDVQPLVDYITARVQERVFAAIQAADKFAYDDKHVDLIKGIIKGVLEERVGRGLREGTTQVTAPLVANVATADRAARLLPDVKFQAELDGAIHKTNVTGTLSV